MRYRALIVTFFAFCLAVLTACSDTANGLSKDQLTYDDIVNTGLANSCPTITQISRGSIDVEAGKQYLLKDLCVEPQKYFVKEEPLNKRQEAEFVSAKIVTRYTSSLDQVSGTISVAEDGVLNFKEEDGIDFQTITVQLPGGEQVPFFFTIKSLDANTKPGPLSINSSTDFVGEFKVPSYRGATFLDPKARGTASGYDNAVALPAESDSEEYNRANVKRLVSGVGEMSLQITNVDQETGEISGVFESEQPSATDLGAEDPEEVKIQGVFYGRIEAKA